MLSSYKLKLLQNLSLDFFLRDLNQQNATSKKGKISAVKSRILFIARKFSVTQYAKNIPTGIARLHLQTDLTSPPRFAIFLEVSQL